MEYKMNSSLLRVRQPCCYWEFQEYLYGIESQETEYIEERANEVVDIPEPGQPWLSDLTGKMFPGKIAKTSVRRMDLPPDHPEYQGLEECELDWDKAKEIISRCWFDTLSEWIDDRYRAEGVAHDKRIKIEFTGTWSPKEYNFKTDECDFLLSASMDALRHIIEKCLIEYREGFETYLREAHSSYSGYRSYMSNDIYDYERYWEWIKENGDGEPDGEYSKFDRVEHLVWACLDFWLFGIEDILSGEIDKLSGDAMKKRWGKNQDRFSEYLWYNVERAESNGAFYEVMKYKPKEVEEVAA